ncbi:hypothetical protein ACTXT7_007592 [Hymenolepis weldensis]
MEREQPFKLPRILVNLQEHVLPNSIGHRLQSPTIPQVLEFTENYPTGCFLILQAQLRTYEITSQSCLFGALIPKVADTIKKQSTTPYAGFKLAASQGRTEPKSEQSKRPLTELRKCSPKTKCTATQTRVDPHIAKFPDRQQRSILHNDQPNSGIRYRAIPIR